MFDSLNSLKLKMNILDSGKEKFRNRKIKKSPKTEN